MKIGNSFLLLILFYLLGYTSWLGGPWGFGKFLFIVTLIFWIMGLFFYWRLRSFTRNIQPNEKKNEEIIKVDAKIIK